MAQYYSVSLAHKEQDGSWTAFVTLVEAKFIISAVSALHSFVTSELTRYWTLSSCPPLKHRNVGVT
jgi:hypothetical protein